MYFNLLPYTYYTLDDNQSVQIIQNLTLKVIINDKIKNNYSIMDEYDVVDGETPEIVSYKIYRTPQLHWFILLTNDIVDPRFEWPLSNYDLIQYCEGKYTNPYDTHHWENTDGYVVNETAPGAVSVSNFQYEDRLNESKRRIKLIKPRYVDAIVSEIKSKLSRAV